MKYAIGFLLLPVAAFLVGLGGSLGVSAASVVVMAVLFGGLQ